MNEIASPVIFLYGEVKRHSPLSLEQLETIFSLVLRLGEMLIPCFLVILHKNTLSFSFHSRGNFDGLILYLFLFTHLEISTVCAVSLTQQQQNRKSLGSQDSRDRAENRTGGKTDMKMRAVSFVIRSCTNI